MALRELPANYTDPDRAWRCAGLLLPAMRAVMFSDAMGRLAGRDAYHATPVGTLRRGQVVAICVLHSLRHGMDP